MANHLRDVAHFASPTGAVPIPRSSPAGIASARPPPAVTLQIFAKNPVPGQVKTRLAATVGDDEAAAIHASFVERTLETSVAARTAGIVDRIELWGAPDAEAPVFAEWRDRYGVELRSQSGDDLGARMRHALHSALANRSRAILIGTDCPVLDVDYLAQAVAALDDHVAVFGPAEDGGYVLVGLRRAIDAFSGIPWSSRGHDGGDPRETDGATGAVARVADALGCRFAGRSCALASDDDARRRPP